MNKLEYYVIIYYFEEEPNPYLYIRENGTPLFNTKEEAEKEAKTEAEDSCWESYTVLTENELFKKYDSNELKSIFWKALVR